PRRALVVVVAHRRPHLARLQIRVCRLDLLGQCRTESLVGIQRHLMFALRFGQGLLLHAEEARAFAIGSPAVGRAKTFEPTSIPTSRPVGDTSWVGACAQEQHTDQPCASRETVTVLLVPATGRLQRTAIHPILARAKQPLSNWAPLPYS